MRVTSVSCRYLWGDSHCNYWNSWWHWPCVVVIGCQAWSWSRDGVRGVLFEWAFRRTSKSLFGKMVWLSLMWLLLTYFAYMWKFSSVLRCGPFLCRLKICIVFWMFPSGWLCSMRCCANFDVWLFVFNACLCSLNLLWKFFQSGPHTLCCILGMWVCIYPRACIYHLFFVLCVGVCFLLSV